MGAETGNVEFVKNSIKIKDGLVGETTLETETTKGRLTSWEMRLENDCGFSFLIRDECRDVEYIIEITDHDGDFVCIGISSIHMRVIRDMITEMLGDKDA